MKTLELPADTELDFTEAKKIATGEAAKHLQEPMALSWMNHRTGKHSPDVECCQEDGKESWEIYAESRGGTIRVEIADQYVFIFTEGQI
jgi:hypothetical protein